MINRDTIEGYIGGLVIGAIIGVLLGLAAIAAAKAADDLVPPTDEERADIATWIPRTCCWTNGCCFKVPPASLRHLGGEDWQVMATGQIVKRTDWSKDGQTWRCTCDYEGERGWVAHPKANTRCIFPVQPNS